LKEAFGIDIPRDEVDSGLSYTGGFFKLKPEYKNEKLSFELNFDHGEKWLQTLLFPVDNNLIVAAIGTYGRRQVPVHNHEELIQFLNQPDHLRFVEKYKMLEVVIPFKTYSNANKSVWKHAENVKNWPENYILMGDSVACFNPTYAQGMTQAAVHAYELNSAFMEYNDANAFCNFDGLSKEIQKRLAIKTFDFWMAASSEDLSRSTTVGKRNFFVMQFAEFFHHMIRHLIVNNMFEDFLYVMNGLKGVDSLFTFQNLVHVIPKFILGKFVNNK